MKKKSVVIARRHSTSISLEDEFLAELEKIAREKGISINQLVTEIDSKREHENLSSAIRIYILRHLKKETHRPSRWFFSSGYNPNSASERLKGV